jgi:hypothetical protein
MTALSPSTSPYPAGASIRRSWKRCRRWRIRWFYLNNWRHLHFQYYPTLYHALIRVPRCRGNTFCMRRKASRWRIRWLFLTTRAMNGHDRSPVWEKQMNGSVTSWDSANSVVCSVARMKYAFGIRSTQAEPARGLDRSSVTSSSEQAFIQHPCCCRHRSGRESHRVESSVSAALTSRNPRRTSWRNAIGSPPHFPLPQLS